MIKIIYPISLWFFRSNMERTVEHDNYTCQEILVLEPLKYKKGNIFGGKVLEKNDLTLPDSKSVSALLEKDTHC